MELGRSDFLLLSFVRMIIGWYLKSFVLQICVGFDRSEPVSCYFLVVMGGLLLPFLLAGVFCSDSFGGSGSHGGGGAGLSWLLLERSHEISLIIMKILLILVKKGILVSTLTPCLHYYDLTDSNATLLLCNSEKLTFLLWRKEDDLQRPLFRLFDRKIIFARLCLITQLFVVYCDSSFASGSDSQQIDLNWRCCFSLGKSHMSKLYYVIHMTTKVMQTGCVFSPNSFFQVYHLFVNNAILLLCKFEKITFLLKWNENYLIIPCNWLFTMILTGFYVIIQLLSTKLYIYAFSLGTFKTAPPVSGRPNNGALVINEPAVSDIGKKVLFSNEQMAFCEADIELDEFTNPSDENMGVLAAANEVIPSSSSGHDLEAMAMPLSGCLFQGLGLTHGPSCEIHQPVLNSEALLLNSTTTVVVPCDTVVPENVGLEVGFPNSENVELSDHLAVVPDVTTDFLCEENVYYDDDDYVAAYDDELEPESSFHAIDSTSSFIRKLNGDMPLAMADHEATSGSSKRKAMDQDDDDMASTGQKKPKLWRALSFM